MHKEVEFKTKEPHESILYHIHCIQFVAQACMTIQPYDNHTCQMIVHLDKEHEHLIKLNGSLAGVALLIPNRDRVAVADHSLGANSAPVAERTSRTDKVDTDDGLSFDKLTIV